jgi:hypothetical protein
VNDHPHTAAVQKAVFSTAVVSVFAFDSESLPSDVINRTLGYHEGFPVRTGTFGVFGLVDCEGIRAGNLFIL